MTNLDTLAQIQTRAVAAGGSAWVDEIIVRGGSTGVVGAHLKIGWETPNINGVMTREGTEALPLLLETGDPLWESVKSHLGATVISQVLDLQSKIADLEYQLETAAAYKAQADQTLDAQRLLIESLQSGGATPESTQVVQQVEQQSPPDDDLPLSDF